MEEHETIRRKTAANAVYQTLYQVLTLITPLITSPYISRVLGADNLGIFTFSFSIVSYFMLISALGVVNYGTRTVALCKNNRFERSVTFWNLYSMQLLSSSIAIVGYCVYLIAVYKRSNNNSEFAITMIQGLWLLGTTFDVSWFFFGVEDFKKTVTRSIMIKLLTVLSILLFVKRGLHPLITYTIIMAGGHFISVLVLIPMLKQYIDYVPPKWQEMRKHIKPNLVLFIPLLASSIFHTMDKTMLGIMSPSGTKTELGYYYNSDKLVNIPLQIINGFGTVFLPRATKLFSESRKKGLLFIDKTFEINIAVTCLLSFGIAGCAKEFVPFFFGPGYEECIILAYLFVPILMVKAVSIFFRMQYLVPTHGDLIYTKATIAGAVVNVIANAVLIPDYLLGVKLMGLGAKGAVIGTFIAETVVMVYQFMAVKKSVPTLQWIKKSSVYLLIGLFVLLSMRLSARMQLYIIFQLILEIIVGGIVFFLFAVMYWRITGKCIVLKEEVINLFNRKKNTN